ncbi:hypothetical protein [Roseibium suaedae]|uniref:Uncharacterized protein n=1 Tax=Roseibium suaedae TaxID=735517 RepID=A0A1M7P6M7_9HYPH|nr:hypothetical protein [Roseibium suaedae]SHN12340.1 hypothetical protein SAMN05444272_4153 [Roseibium suaedae]
MIEVGLIFKSEFKTLVDVVSNLPEVLRPRYFSSGELVESKKNLVSDKDKLRKFLAGERTGFFLIGDQVSYYFNALADDTISLDCFLNATPETAKTLLEHLLVAKPFFGFACKPEEREQRNRIVMQFGANTIEGWVGRDISKYLPGLYWLTVLSKDLAERHSIDLQDLGRYSRKSVKTSDEVYVLTFHDDPEEWSSMNVAADFYSDHSNIFNIEHARQELSKADNLMEFLAMTRRWP